MKYYNQTEEQAEKAIDRMLRAILEDDDQGKLPQDPNPESAHSIDEGPNRHGTNAQDKDE